MAQTEKERATRELMQQADKVRSVFKDFKTTNVAYFENGFNTGGSDEIVDADLTNLNIEAADLTNIVSLLQQLDNLLEGQAVIQTQFKTVLSKTQWWAK